MNKNDGFIYLLQMELDYIQNKGTTLSQYYFALNKVLPHKLFTIVSE